MEKNDWRRRGSRAAGLLAATALLLAACGPRSDGPAPLVTGGQPPPPAQIAVQPGQTLSGIAHAYHVPMHVLADANHLVPPYRIRIGQALVIPDGGEAGPPGPSVAMTEPMPMGGPTSAPYQPSPPPFQPAPPTAVPPTAPVSVQPIPLDRPPPPASANSTGAAAPPMALSPPASAAPHASRPLPPAAALASPTAETAVPPAENAPPPPAERAPPPAASAAPPSAAPGATAAVEPPAPPRNGGSFQWPVRGHVLEGYGVGPDGTHNDGINIAAPRGAAVQATDAGVVAYSGNELRGYGNLILIKHSNGWISAYAHCDLILVKTGQKVARGQVIARVGATGNVSEPQLHFELRRGKKPVDPREYLAPLPTAATKEPHAS